MKKNQCEVSIIVPVYNVEKYIDKCIDSILGQTFNNFEVILIDDGSTDSSSIKCDEYTRRDSRIKVIHKKNEGLSVARNLGIKNAKGRYITFIDSDDYIGEEYIKILYDYITINKADIAMCSFKRFKSNNEVIDYYIDDKISILNSKECLENLYNREWLNYVTVWGNLYKKELFNNIKFPEGKINEDLFIIHKLYLEAKKIIYNNSQLYFYRQTEGSITNKKFTYKNFDDLEAFEEHINYYIENKYHDLEIQAIHRYCYHLKYFYRRFKNDVGDLKGLKIIREKHKNIKKYVRSKEYYSLEEKDFVNAPWCHEMLIEPYWFLIAIKNKINRIMKG